MTTNYANVKWCNTCGNIFKQIWQDQESCTACQPLAVNPVVQELIRGMATKAWGDSASDLVTTNTTTDYCKEDREVIVRTDGQSLSIFTR